MQKLLTVIVLTCSLFACSKTATTIPYQEPSKTQKIIFKVRQVGDYSSSIYDQVYAEVKLGIYKQSLTDTTKTDVWDTLLVRQHLRQFPSANNPFLIRKSIQGIYDSKQSVRSYYIIKYDNQGTNQLSGANIPFTSGVDTMQVDVPL